MAETEEDGLLRSNTPVHTLVNTPNTQGGCIARGSSNVVVTPTQEWLGFVTSDKGTAPKSHCSMLSGAGTGDP